MSNLTDKLRTAERRNADKILNAIGAAPQYPNTHASCPLPGHDDNNPSFRYDPESGRCFCSCRPQGVSLTDVVAEIRGINTGDKPGFISAVKAVEEITGETILTQSMNGRAKPNGKPTPEQEAQAKQAEQEQAEADAERKAEAERKRQWIEGELQRMVPITGAPAETYLRQHRGLTDIDLRFDDLGFMGDFRCKPDGKAAPAMVAVVRTPDGAIVGMQGTLLNADGSPKRDAKDGKIKLSSGALRDGFVTLKHPSATCTAIAEGIETGLTRLVAGPAEVRVCLGSVRPVAFENTAGRVEIIADVDKTSKARMAARELAQSNKSVSAFVVAVPPATGRTADLNDLLDEMGPGNVICAIDDADRIHARQNRGNVEQLEIGSDGEVAGLTLERIENLFGSTVFSEGDIWHFDGRIWQPLEGGRLDRHVHGFDGATYSTPAGSPGRYLITSQKVRSVLDLMRAKRDNESFFADGELGIACSNCFIALQKQPDGSFQPIAKPHMRGQRARHLVVGEWYPDQDIEGRLENSDLQRLLDGMFDAGKTRKRLRADAPGIEFSEHDAEVDSLQRVQLVLEAAALAALGYGTRIKHPKAQIWHGPGGAGKSTMRKVISALVDPRAIAAIPPNQMGGDANKFMVAGLRGVALNAAEEVGGRSLGAETFKRVVTGDVTTAEHKFEKPFTFTPFAQHILLCNDIPTFAGGIDGGVERRICIVPFDNSFGDEEGQQGTDGLADEGLADRIIANEMDLLLALVVKVGCALLARGAMINPRSCQVAKTVWMSDADRVRGWAAERLERVPNSTVTVTDLYDDFRSWWIDEGIGGTMPAKNSFSRRLTKSNGWLIRGTDSVSARFINARLRTR